MTKVSKPSLRACCKSPMPLPKRTERLAQRCSLWRSQFLTLEPRVHTLATHVDLLGHLGDRETISQNLAHGVIMLFHFA
jgi:hypothetical protein